MSDIFGRENMVRGGGFVADTGVISDADGISGLLMQSIQVQYQRPITKLFELGVAGSPSKVYYVEGRPQGNVTIARIIGFSVTIKTFYEKYGSSCSENKLRLDLTSAQCIEIPRPAPPPVGLQLHGCVLTSVGFNIQAQQLVVNENSTMEFANMEYIGP